MSLSKINPAKLYTAEMVAQAVGLTPGRTAYRLRVRQAKPLTPAEREIERIVEGQPWYRGSEVIAALTPKPQLSGISNGPCVVEDRPDVRYPNAPAVLTFCGAVMRRFTREQLDALEASIASTKAVLGWSIQTEAGQ